MRSWCAGALLCSVWASSASAVVREGQQQEQVRRVADQSKAVLVLYVDRQVRTNEELIAALPEEIRREISYSSMNLIFSKPRTLGGFEAWVEFEVAQESDSAVQALRESQSLLDVHTSYKYTGNPQERVNDPMFEKQLHHQVMKSDMAWLFTFGRREIVVAVTDDGVDLKHEDLKDSIWQNKAEIPGNQIDDDNNGYIDDVNGWDFSENDNDPNPIVSAWGGDHGTHVAGIIAASANNGRGLVGTAPNVSIMPIRFYGSGAWTSAVVARSYAYAVDNGARIISTSYNVDSLANDPVYVAALDYAYERGVLVFNSAGNSNQKDPIRQKLDQYLLVCSTEVRTLAVDRKSDFSNYGSGVDVCAPGSDIHSTLPDNQYGEMSGTSMATPNAAAVAALIWSLNPRWTRDQVAAQLLGTSQSISNRNTDDLAKLLGSGRISAFRSVMARPRSAQLEFSNLVRTTRNDAFGVAGVELAVTGVLEAAGVQNLANWSLKRVDSFGDEEESIGLRVQNRYMIGSNKVVLEFDRVLSPGAYVLEGRNLRDPFGRAINLSQTQQPQQTGGFTHRFSVQSAE